MPPSQVTTAIRSSTFSSRLGLHLSTKPALNLPILPARHHYSSSPVSRIASCSITSFQPRILTQSSFFPTKCISSTRYNSTATPTVDDASTPSTNIPSTPTTATLTWTDFFALRKRRRITNLITSSATGALTLFVGAAFMSGTDIADMGARKFGSDPIIFAGLLTAACGSLGWLAGPFIGNGVWRIANRGRVEVFNLKEKAFYDRIKRYRADPTGQSMSNPVPDYYGEKIGSVAAYRQWLKDQRAFTKKRQM